MSGGISFFIQTKPYSDSLFSHSISGCTQGLIEILNPENDLEIYSQIEDRIRKSEQERFEQLEVAQKQVKSESMGKFECLIMSVRDLPNSMVWCDLQFSRRLLLSIVLLQQEVQQIGNLVKGIKMI